MIWPAPSEIRKPGMTSFANLRAIADGDAQERPAPPGVGREGGGLPEAAQASRGRLRWPVVGQAQDHHDARREQDTVIATRMIRYVPGPPGGRPMAAAMAVATTPPRIAATMLVTFWIANWSANSSLRCPGSLCSVMYGETTTWNAWLPADQRAAATITTRRASLPSSARRATMLATRPVRNTTRRPTRSDHALAGNATMAPAMDAIVATTPIVAGSKPSATR